MDGYDWSIYNLFIHRVEMDACTLRDAIRGRYTVMKNITVYAGNIKDAWNVKE